MTSKPCPRGVNPWRKCSIFSKEIITRRVNPCGPAVGARRWEDRAEHWGAGGGGRKCLGIKEGKKLHFRSMSSRSQCFPNVRAVTVAVLFYVVSLIALLGCISIVPRPSSNAYCVRLDLPSPGSQTFSPRPAQKSAPSLSLMATLVCSATSSGVGVASILTTRPCFS